MTLLVPCQTVPYLRRDALVDLIQTLNVPLILTALLLRLKIHVPCYFVHHPAHQEFHLVLVPRTLMVAPLDQTLAVHLPKSYVSVTRQIVCKK